MNFPLQWQIKCPSATPHNAANKASPCRTQCGKQSVPLPHEKCGKQNVPLPH